MKELFSLLRGVPPRPEWTDETWRSILAFADSTHSTLHLRRAAGLPAWVEQQIEERFAKNAARRSPLLDAYREIAKELDAREISHVLLKGFTHESGFGLRQGTRAQNDLDILVSPPDRARASIVLDDLGYRPHGTASLSAEHERPWVRPFTWAWQGDYFDPETPIPVELHDTVWSGADDRIQCPGVQEFWNRKEHLGLAGMQVPVFCEVDRVAFAALHALRHILRNDASPVHVFELARVLETAPEHLWIRWRAAHSQEARQLQAIAFRFAEEWFGCALPEPVRQECLALPPTVRSWLEKFPWSPVENLTRPNKDVLWLHLALLRSRRDRWSVTWNRLLPLKLPHESIPARLRYHASALFPALKEGVRWWWSRTASSTVSHISD